MSYQFTPSNNGSTPGTDGFGIDETIKTGGKLGLQKAAAEMDLQRRIGLAPGSERSGYAGPNAYFGVLVAKETVRVNKALAHSRRKSIASRPICWPGVRHLTNWRPYDTSL